MKGSTNALRGCDQRVLLVPQCVDWIEARDLE